MATGSRKDCVKKTLLKQKRLQDMMRNSLFTECSGYMQQKYVRSEKMIQKEENTNLHGEWVRLKKAQKTEQRVSHDVDC